MLPLGVKSSHAVMGVFLVPLRNDGNVDYEWGGIKLRDTTQGLRYQIWQSGYNLTAITARGSKTGTLTVILQKTGIVHHSLSFDQNMNPCVVYRVKNDPKTYLYWYNPVTSKQETMTFNITMEYPQVSMDDKRNQQSAISDIILSYTRDNKAYYRLQRERYETEHELGDAVNQRLIQTGMTRNLRFRWRLVTKKQGE